MQVLGGAAGRGPVRRFTMILIFDHPSLILPDSHLSRQNLTDSGATKNQVNQTEVLDQVTIPVYLARPMHLHYEPTSSSLWSRHVMSPGARMELERPPHGAPLISTIGFGTDPESNSHSPPPPPKRLIGAPPQTD